MFIYVTPHRVGHDWGDLAAAAAAGIEGSLLTISLLLLLRRPRMVSEILQELLVNLKSNITLNVGVRI